MFDKKNRIGKVLDALKGYRNRRYCKKCHHRVDIHKAPVHCNARMGTNNKICKCGCTEPQVPQLDFKITQTTGMVKSNEGKNH